MALKYGFFNSINGDRKYNAEDIGRYLQGIITSGVYADQSDSLQVVADEGLVVAVQPGRAMLDFHYLENETIQYLNLASGNTLPRYDAVVAKLDYTNRIVTIEIKQGSPSIEPEKPVPERSETVKEYCLAYIYIDKLATAISQSNIIDTRPSTELCGWVTAVIDQVPTETLFKQWETAGKEYFASLDEMAAELQKVIDGITQGSEVMLKTQYDKNNSGVVDNAEKVNGFWFDFFDEEGNPSDEPYIHWGGAPVIEGIAEEAQF